ncbi:hypothetical protein MCAP1_001673 [Malassezia caprae]|uniref:Sfi1 spindle body domain-containing protein n=1 Tax=Malassezia caprae TaxID=1381934 RepID=A0AAF0E8A9_9BASI|nr:hypothetical protein MCAP1_001673 [Malassezia caprae]
MAPAAPAAADASTSALSSSVFFHAGASPGSEKRNASRLHQLTASFALDDAEVAFFDAVVAMLPAASTSFAELKHAYNACRHDTELVTPIARVHAFRASQGDTTPSIDARLWNTLLSLVQVRGHTWAERWDMVRVALGLEPLEDVMYPPASPSLAPPSPMSEDDAPMDAVHGSPAWSPLQLVHQRVPPRALDAVRWPRVPLATVLERRATDLERRHLRRYLVRWNEHLFFCASRLERAAQAYTHLLALRAWGLWRTRRAAQLDAAAAAAAHAQHATAVRVWRAWRIATEERVHARHKEQARTLRAAFLAVESRRHARLERIALTLWTQAWHGRQASAMHRRALLPRAWGAWRARSASLDALDSRRTLFAAYAHRHLLGAAIDAWRQRISERRCQAYLSVSADKWGTQRILHTAWRQWCASAQHSTALQQHADQWAAARERRMLVARLHEWRWAARSACIATHVDLTRLRAAWHQWWVAYTDTTLARQAALLQLQDQTATRQLTRVWTQWHAKLAHLRAQAHVAALTSAWRQRHAAWHVWSHAWRRCQQAGDAAAQYARVRRLRASIAHWRDATRTRKADACVARMQRRLLVHSWDQWRWQSVRVRHWRTCTALVEARRDAQATHASFGHWRLRSAQRVAQAAAATATHAAALQRRYIRAWHARLVWQRARSADALAWHEARHATGPELVRLLVRAWRSRAVLQAAEGAMVMRVLHRMWRRWRDVLVEAQLQHEELAALAARRQSILRACWARWTQRTQSLPALHLQRARLLKCALSQWQQRVQARRVPRLAKAFALSTVGADALASWRHRLAHRQQTPESCA